VRVVYRGREGVRGRQRYRLPAFGVDFVSGVPQEVSEEVADHVLSIEGHSFEVDPDTEPFEDDLSEREGVNGEDA
jgi:hypothetical protein